MLGYWKCEVIENIILHHILIILFPTLLNIFFVGPYTLAVLVIYFKDIEYHKKCLCKKLLALDKQILSIQKYFIISLLPSTHRRNIFASTFMSDLDCVYVYFSRPQQILNHSQYFIKFIKAAVYNTHIGRNILQQDQHGTKMYYPAEKSFYPQYFGRRWY